MNLPYSPYDLLPIEHPSNEPHKDDPTFFYRNVVVPLIPTIIDMESHGIPINLDKVAELEVTLTDILTRVHNRLKNNELMIEFLTYISKGKKELKKEELKSKKKTWKDFIKPFDIKNKIHRTYVVNTYLISQVHKDKIMNEWSIKDLKILNQMIASKFIQNILDKNIESWMLDAINLGMTRLAVYQAETYNKNRIDTKIDEIDRTKIIHLFNPASSLQKRQLFEYLGIESDNETKGGNDKWDRKELERIQKLLNIMIKDRE